MSVEKWTLDDGRRAEKRVTEIKSEEGQSEKITELLTEIERPLCVSQRVIEKTKPFVFERIIQTVDVDGKVIDQKIESIEPKVQLQLVEHIGVDNSSKEVSAQNVEEDCDCHVTKEEMIDTVIAAIKATKEMPSLPVENVQDFSDRLSSLGLADEIENRMNISGLSTSDKLVLSLIAIVLVSTAYIVFFI